jgi:hypothetical protein
VGGFAVAVVTLFPFGVPPWGAALIGFGVAFVIAVTLTVLERRRRPPPQPSLGPVAISITGGSGHRVHDNLSVGVPLLRADNTNDLDAERNVTIMPPPERDKPKE